MASPARKAEQRFTYSDYLSWDDGGRWELIDGVAYCMTPAPSLPHQHVSAQLVGQLVVAPRGHVCTAFHAPSDVLLPADDSADREQDTVVQPDVFVVCDATKLANKRNCRGAPDFIAEILSLATATRDQREKLALYERHGVREYWVIDPVHGTVAIRILGTDGKYGAPTVAGEGEVELTAVPGIRVDLSTLFPPPDERD